jgi:hypothetical protein
MLYGPPVPRIRQNSRELPEQESFGGGTEAGRLEVDLMGADAACGVQVRVAVTSSCPDRSTFQ